MQIRTIRKGLEALELKFEPFEMDSKHLNANSNHSKGIGSIRIEIRTIRKVFEALKCKFEPFERVRVSIEIQIRTIWNGFEAFKCKFEPFERDW